MGTGGSDDTAIDTQAPSVVVNIVDPQIIAGETSDVTFTFSEKVTGFELGDLTVVGGTVTGLTSSDGGKTWTATFTPTPAIPARPASPSRTAATPISTATWALAAVTTPRSTPRPRAWWSTLSIRRSSRVRPAT
ncbi:hypothetical protein IL332_16740 [Aeromonas caviae]|nr:hypothetical protein IL332_16740 [Aeromonas caviae]